MPRTSIAASTPRPALPARLALASMLALSAAAPACRNPPTAAPGAGGTATGARPPLAPPAPPEGPPAAQAPRPTETPRVGREEGNVLLVENGQERFIPAEEAVANGYTLVDLGDDWTPFLFAEQRDESGAVLPNRYRRVFIGLANDKLDEDGRPLAPGEKNFLELYGIFPSLSVLRARFLESEARPCHDGTDLAALEAVETVSYIPPQRVRQEERRMAKIARELEVARRRLRVKTLADLAARDPRLGPKVKLVEKRAAEKAAMAEVEKRLECEGFLRKGDKHVKGLYDDPMRLAVRAFQQKHMIYEAHYLRRRTMEALARPMLENDHQSLFRTLRERVVDAAAIIEDGSAGGRAGRNLDDELTQATIDQLGLGTVEGALAFFKRHSPADLAHLRAAVKLPARPDYYGENMDLSVVIDRGDVWYDPPWDASGVRNPQPRKKYPHFTLYVKADGKRMPLVRWRTTVGGWRAEQAPDGYEYFRYKGSDVGPRVIRQVVAGPVWIAPASTPIRSLVKSRVINGGWTRVVNYDDLGPGYLSAYGLVAGYFVVPGKNGRPDWDNGIRAHGSADYLSIYSATGFSHGCHRLPNHLAIRLYSFILRHRPMRVVGDQPMNFSRQFLRGEEVFELRIPSRGYAYMLDPPIPVDVLEGEIKGVIKQPITTYVPKPGVRYPGPPPPAPDSPEARAGGAAAAAPKADAEEE